jgi:uracil-DNA glycosylase family 4
MVESKTGVDSSSEYVWQLASALRARLRFHQQCGISAYPPLALPSLPKKAELPPSQPQNMGGENMRQQALEKTKTEEQSRPQTMRRLKTIAETVRACTLCALAPASPARTVGLGRARARLLVVGDYAVAEGQNSGPLPSLPADQITLCFGKAEDELLWKMMQAIGLGPQDVYVTNALKCFLPQEQEPGIESLWQCRQHLFDEIAAVQPAVVCAMGDTAASALLGGTEPVARLRGRAHLFRTGGAGAAAYRVMVTYHPRLLLRLTDMKAAAWQDLQQVRSMLHQRGTVRG